MMMTTTTMMMMTMMISDLERWRDYRARYTRFRNAT